MFWALSSPYLAPTRLDTKKQFYYQRANLLKIGTKTATTTRVVMRTGMRYWHYEKPQVDSSLIFDIIKVSGFQGVQSELRPVLRKLVKNSYEPSLPEVQARYVPVNKRRRF